VIDAHKIIVSGMIIYLCPVLQVHEITMSNVNAQNPMHQFVTQVLLTVSG